MLWLIVEDALRDRKGHWFEYVSTFVRGLRTLGDEVEVLCDRKAERFILESLGARAVLPESIWHRMGDGTGALKRYARVPGHAIATFFAIRKFLKEFNHRGHGELRGGNAKKQEINHENHEKAGIDEAGHCLDKPSCVEFSNPSTSELARECENTSLNRCTSGHAYSLPATSHSLRAIVPEALTPATSYPLPATSRPPNWIFVPTVLVHHLLGWWLLLKTDSLPRSSRVLLFFPNLPIRLDEVGKSHWNGGPTTNLMAWLFASLRKEVDSGRLVLGVETNAMQRALESLIGVRVVYLPHPVEAHAEARRRGGEEDLITTDQREIDCRRQLRRSESRESKDTESTEVTAGQCLDKPISAVVSNPLPSELARECENTAHNRSAIGPTYLSANSYSQPFTASRPLVFGCYGAARWEKGSDIFQEAIKLILKNEVKSKENQSAKGISEPVTSYPLLDMVSKVSSATLYPLPVTAPGRSLHFAIQWIEGFRDAGGNLVQLDLWLKNHPQVDVIDRYFEEEGYERQLKKTDVMVLPYRSPYQLRVSRVVIEAMICGMPVIATRRTTLFEQAEKYGVAIECEEGSAESLAKAILKVAESFNSLQASAMERATSARESFSVEYFRNLLSYKNDE